MIFKIKHIATRFLFQSIFTILIISSLIFIMFYSGFRKKDTLEANSVVEDIHFNIVLANLTLEKALAQQKANPYFVELGCDVLLKDQSSRIIQITESILKLDSIKYLRTSFERNNLKDSLNGALKEYNLLFSKVLLSFKEKGNENGGFIQKANESINSVTEELHLTPDNGLQAAVFKGYTSAYLADFSYKRLYSLINFCDEIVTPFYYLEDYDPGTLEELVSKLKKDLEQIQTIDLRLLNEESSVGQLLDLAKAYEVLNLKFDSLKTAVEEETISYNAFWNWVFTILAIVLTTTYVLVMGRFSQIVRTSVKNLHRITISLANGSIKETIPENGRFEFNAFYEDFRSLFSLLNSRKDFINNLLNEKFDTKLEVKGKTDEIGNSLIKLQEKMHAAQQEQAKNNELNLSRRYINEGLTKFAEVMRVTSNDITELSDTFIKELVKYMEAMQGGLFLTEENNSEKLDLIAAFAFDRKRYLAKTIKKGEGLIGTCAIERRTINITEIPQDYIAIKSGLGDAPPKNILIVPVMNDDGLVGVIEMASLNVFREIEVELAESIASSLATTILAARTNSQTAQLLKKSQEQAAEMAEQEEEMRQNMEELKATQEESARREEEMQGLLNSIGESFYVLEYDLTGSIIHVNNRLLEFTEHSIEQVMQKKHQDIFSSDSIISENYIRDVIENKKPETLRETLNWGSKKFNYKYFISPVFASNGDVIKVLNLFSIDESK